MDITTQQARRILAQRLESLQLAGVLDIGRVPAQPAASPTTPTRSVSEGVPPPAAATPTPLPAPQETPMPRPKAAAPTSLAAAAASLIRQPYPANLPSDAPGCRSLLTALDAEVKPCQLCRELAATRKQTVFGVGNPRARVVFFGEAPGADEDLQGEPFVGRAGQLLTKIIEACGWQRSDVYIMNVLKCRPPENRNPSPQETAKCRPFFERQFEILRPEYIVCVGTVPAQALLETTDSVGKLRSRFHRYRDSTVLVTYHPSYLLRNPSAKKYVWEDMQLLLKEMGLPVPGKK
jgi:uracil-DNA glycosylase family 4